MNEDVGDGYMEVGEIAEIAEIAEVALGLVL